MIDISTFNLDILRKDRLAQFSNDSKEGDAFQQLCFDILNSHLKDRLKKLTLFKTSGPDGAIDISGVENEGHFIICECKKNNTLDLAKKSLSKLKDTLQRNLKKPGAADSRYASWFDSNFKEYIYCVSCSIDTDDELKKFEKSVEGMIRGLAAIKGLSHLEKVAVTVYVWNDLKPILENNRFLYHKWIEPDGVPGCEYLRKHITINPERHRYADYLYSSRLLYISRNDYRRQNPGFQDLITESEILERVLLTNQDDGCIIHGEGGIGKTRLMMELGFMAEELGWIVYKITNELKSLEPLKYRLFPHNKYLLIFDYIEENPLFEVGIVEKLQKICEEATIKVIGNCRNTYIGISDLSESENFWDVDLSLKDTDSEICYKNYVVETILGQLSRLFPIEKDFYILRPAFAVFLRFLNEKYGEEEPEFDFRDFESFRKWLRKRLRLTFGEKDFSDLNKKKERFYLFSILPSTGQLTDRLSSEFRDVIIPLKRDGWLEDDENKREEKGEHKNELRVIHHTIADEILMFRLQESREVLKSELKSIFDFAIAQGCFENCFSAFSRISGCDILRDRRILFYELFSQYIETQTVVCESLKTKFIKTSLMDKEAIVTLIMEKLDFFEESIKELPFGLKLSLKMKSLSKKESSPELKDKIKLLLNRWLTANHEFLRHKYISARVISSFMVFFGLKNVFGENGETIETYAWKWLEKYPDKMETHFVIKSWLDARGDKSLIEKYLKGWLQKFPKEMETSFVIKSWLDAGGDKSLIEEYLKGWLQKFPNVMETSFVIQSWLDPGGDKSLIEEYLKGWLKKFPKEMETSFVIKSWLDVGGDKSLIEEYLKGWLKKFPEEMETSFVIKSWLDAGGDKSLIEEYLKGWLKKFPKEKDTQFVIVAWLDAGGDKSLIEEYLKGWLKKFPEEMETSFVIKSWLDAGGDKSLIEEYLKGWFQKFPQEMETSFVIKSWLNAGGDKSLIEEYLKGWLQKFPEEKDTQFVMVAWLDAGGDKSLIEEYLKGWLQKFPEEMETNFVIKYWLDAGGDKSLIEEYLKGWLKKFPKEKDAQFVMVAWLDAGGDKSLIEEYLKGWLQKFLNVMETSFVIKSWLDARGDKSLIEEYLKGWLQKFPKKTETRFVLTAWLEAGGNREIAKKYIKPWLEKFPLNEENTSFVIKAWLNAGGEPEEVVPFVAKWLEVFQNSFEASYVIRAWIKRTKDAVSIKEYAHRWLQIYKGHQDADFVIKRFCRFEDIPDDVLEAAIYWCKKYCDDSEVLYTLSYLSRNHMENKMFADQWLPEVISPWITREKLSNDEIQNLESIMYNSTKNKAFCRSKECIEITKKWFLSAHSFNPSTLHSRFSYLQRWWYFEKYKSLFIEERIDFSTDEEKIKKFLYWVNKWSSRNKKNIKRNIYHLKEKLPQYNHLWDIVRFE